MHRILYSMMNLCSIVDTLSMHAIIMLCTVNFVHTLSDIFYILLGLQKTFSVSENVLIQDESQLLEQIYLSSEVRGNSHMCLKYINR